MIQSRRLVFISFLLALFVTLLFAKLGENGASAQGPVASGGQVGVPWRGSPGVTETIAQIMAREAASPQKPSKPRATPRRLVPRPPSARSNSPALNLAGGTSSAPLRSSPQPIGTLFLGVQLSEAGFIPPDTMGDVGPTQILFVENGRVKSFDRTGVVGTLNVTLDGFFASLSPGGIGTGDVNVRYDRLTGRWFVTCLDFDSPSRIFIGVSSGSTLTNTTGFTFFQFQTDQVGGSPNVDTGADADYDSLGVDKFSLYIGMNMFIGSSSFGSTGFVVNKADLLANTLTVTAFRALALCNPACSNGPVSPRGVANDDPQATEGYFIGMDNFFYTSLITMRRITYTLGITPTISGNIFVSIPSTALPILVPAKGSTTPIDSVSNDLFNAQIHKNQLTGASSLWTAHNIEVNTSGDSVSGGGRDGSRWYEITDLTTTPSVNQFGTLFDPTVTNPRSYWVPTVALSGQGHMAMGASFASVNDYAGIAVAGRYYSDPSGTIRSPSIAQNGLGSYNIVDGSGRNRWGDYTRTIVDPNDDMTMWTFQEYANKADSWGVKVVQLKAPVPALPAFASPPSVAPSLASVDIAIKGLDLANSGFFDPGPDVGGPGYRNHITATVSGGVTVNSVTFSSPTMITLNISTLGATPGAHNITVTNPDGQSSVGYCVLTVTGASTPSMCRQIFPLIFK